MAAVQPGTVSRPQVRRARRPTRAEAPLPYINRELSWLEFNARVLHEARDQRNPLLERRRYRSVAAEAGPEPPGPGGGEPLDQPLEPRFSPTTERFVDPTTNVTMRVWVDAASGERRYRADR